MTNKWILYIIYSINLKDVFTLSVIRWSDLREEEFEGVIKATDGVCVVPVGCYEKHGQHLPVATDVYEAVAIAEKTAELEPVCVFPPFQFGDVTGLVNWKGSVIFEPMLLFSMLENYCKEIYRNGFNKIILLNFHGGNDALLQQFQKSLQYEKRDFFVSPISPFRIHKATFAGIYENLKKHGSGYYPELTPEDENVIYNFIDNKKSDGHGGLMETCLMLAIKPETVRLDRMDAESGLSTKKGNKLRDAGFTGVWSMNHPNSYAGHSPVGASDRIGKLLLRLFAEVTANACKCIKEEYPVYEEYNNSVWSGKQ